MRALWASGMLLTLGAAGCSLTGLDRFDFPGCVEGRCDVLNARDGISPDACRLWVCDPQGECVFGPRDPANPMGLELCNGFDDDCNGVIDDARATPAAPVTLVAADPPAAGAPFMAYDRGETGGGAAVLGIAYAEASDGAAMAVFDGTPAALGPAAHGAVALAATTPPDDPTSSDTEPLCSRETSMPVIDPPVVCTTSADCPTVGATRCARRPDGTGVCEIPLSHGTTARRVGEDGALAPAGPAAGDALGASVALSADGTRALVGMPGASTGGAGSGSAIVWSWDGTVWAVEAVLEPGALAAGDELGRAVALSADGAVAAVGAPGAGVGGAAFVFARTGTTWAEQATLTAAAATAGDAFGRALALDADGTRAIIGAPDADTARGADAGSALVFLRAGTTWAEEIALVPSAGAGGDGFGSSVALDATGTRAIAGAPRDDAAGADAGTAWAFLRTGTGWAEEARLAAPDAAAGDRHGVAVAVSRDGSRALVGADGDDVAGRLDAGSGRIHLRTGTAWAQERALSAGSLQANAHLGVSVALSGDGEKALLGAPDTDLTGAIGGGAARAYVLDRTTWTEQTTLALATPTASDGLGGAVALSADGTRAIVGTARADRAAGMDQGLAVSFTLPCSAHWQCDDGLICNGPELCQPSTTMGDARACRGEMTMPCGAGTVCDETRQACVGITNMTCSIGDAAIAHLGDGEWLVASVAQSGCTDGTVRIGHVVLEDRGSTRYPDHEILARGPLNRSTSFLGIDTGPMFAGCTGEGRSAGAPRGATGIGLAALPAAAPRLRQQGLAAYLAAPRCRGAGACGSPAPTGATGAVDVEVIGLWLEEGGAGGMPIAFVNATGSGLPVRLGVSTSSDARSVGVASFTATGGAGYVVTYPEATGAVAVHVVPALGDPAPVCVGTPTPPCLSDTAPYLTQLGTTSRTTAPLVVPAADLLFTDEEPGEAVAITTHTRSDGSVRVALAWPSATEVVVALADLDPATGAISGEAIVTRAPATGASSVGVAHVASGFLVAGATVGGSVVGADETGGFVVTWSRADGTYALRISDADDMALAPGPVRVGADATFEPIGYVGTGGRLGIVARDADGVVLFPAACGE